MASRNLGVQQKTSTTTRGRKTKTDVVEMKSKQDELTVKPDKSIYSGTNTSSTRLQTSAAPLAIVAKKTGMDRNHNLTKTIATKNYTIRPIVPAAKKELLSVAKAMHRESFGPRVKKLFQPETEAAIQAIESGIYIGWRCPEFTWDCIRLGNHSRCFCDHNLESHASYNGNSIKVKCEVDSCVCKTFRFIPQRPEDIGEFWLPKRPGFDVTTWRAKCRCKHTHVQHNSNSRKCKVRGCACFIFESNFLCAACDKHWEEHETYFDNTNSRQQKGLPYGQEYLPFQELPDLRNICLTGSEENDDCYNAITSGPYAIPPARNPTSRFEPSYR